MPLPTLSRLSPARTLAVAGVALGLSVGVATAITVVGGPGKDTQRGTNSGDTLRALGGDDRLSGRGGNDRIFGGAGADVRDGGAGDDQLTGGAGRDTFHAGAANDQIFARDGLEEGINCGPGRDRATADRSDIVASNCERVNLPPAPPPPVVPLPSTPSPAPLPIPAPAVPPIPSTVIEIPVAADGLAYTLTEVSAPAGNITLRSTNPQVGSHNIALDLAVDVSGPFVSNGGTSEITVTITTPGTYTYYCAVPGHRSAGMFGTLTIT